MGMLTDFSKAKMFGASTDTAMKYAALKSFFSSDTPKKDNKQQSNNNYNNSYYYSENKNSKVYHEVCVPKLSLTDNEKEELQQPVLFDDSNLPLYFQNIEAMKKEAKQLFEKGIGIYRNYYCIVKINKTQKKYLEMFFNKLTSCKENCEIKRIIQLYISNTGLNYLKYFLIFSSNEKISVINKTIKQILSLRINIISSSNNQNNYKKEQTFENIKIYNNEKNNSKDFSEKKDDSNSISISDVELTFPFYIAEMEYLYSGWMWHEADKESAEIWKEKYPEKMEKYISDLKSHKEEIKNHWEVIESNFGTLYNNLKNKINSLTDVQKEVLNNYLEKTESCNELDDLFKLQHDVYYGDGFLWLMKIIPYNDKAEPELPIRKWAFKKYKNLLENKEINSFFSFPELHFKSC